MIGTVTFDGLSQGQLWRDFSVDLARLLDGIVGLAAAPKVAATLGLRWASGSCSASTASASTARAPSAAT